MEESDAWLPLGDVALKTLRELYESKDRDPDCPWIFPGRSNQTKGKKIYSRRRVFERIRKRSALKRYMQKNPVVALKDALQAMKNENYKGGIHLKPKRFAGLLSGLRSKDGRPDGCDEAA